MSSLLARRASNLRHLSISELNESISLCETLRQDMIKRMASESTLFKLQTGIPTLTAIDNHRRRFVAELHRRTKIK